MTRPPTIPLRRVTSYVCLFHLGHILLPSQNSYMTIFSNLLILTLKATISSIPSSLCFTKVWWSLTFWITESSASESFVTYSSPKSWKYYFGQMFCGYACSPFRIKTYWRSWKLKQSSKFITLVYGMRICPLTVNKIARKLSHFDPRTLHNHHLPATVVLYNLSQCWQNVFILAL